MGRKSPKKCARRVKNGQEGKKNGQEKPPKKIDKKSPTGWPRRAQKWAGKPPKNGQGPKNGQEKPKKWVRTAEKNGAIRPLK